VVADQPSRPKAARGKAPARSPREQTPRTESSWSLTEYSDPESIQLWIFRKNLAPAIAPGSKTHPFVCYLTVHFEPRDESGLPDSADSDRLETIETRDIPDIERDDSSVLVGVVLKDGIKDFVFYASDKDEFIRRATVVRDANPGFGFGLEIQRDPRWAAYEDFP
jgi:hypothetical protein